MTEGDRDSEIERLRHDNAELERERQACAGRPVTYQPSVDAEEAPLRQIVEEGVVTPISLAAARRRRISRDNAAEHVAGCLDIAGECAVNARMKRSAFLSLAAAYYDFYDKAQGGKPP